MDGFVRDVADIKDNTTNRTLDTVSSVLDQ